MKTLLLSLMFAVGMFAQTPTAPTVLAPPATGCPTGVTWAAPNPYWNATVADGQSLISYLALQGITGETLAVNPLSSGPGVVIPALVPQTSFAQYCVPTTTPVLLVVVFPKSSKYWNPYGADYAVGPVTKLIQYGFSLSLIFQ